MPNQHSGPKPYHDRDALERLYHDEQMTTAEIAELFGVQQPTISQWMSRLDIPTRTPAESRELRGTVHIPTKPGPHTDREWLIEKYERDNLAINHMAELAGVTDATITRQMDRHGIERRPSHVTRVLRDPGAGFVHADASGYETIKHSVDDHTYNFKIHRLIAIAEWGYHAVDGSVVHHKNGNTWDNRPSNLELLDSHSDHASLHHDKRTRDEYGRYV